MYYLGPTHPPLLYLCICIFVFVSLYLCFVFVLNCTPLIHKLGPIQPLYLYLCFCLYQIVHNCTSLAKRIHSFCICVLYFCICKSCLYQIVHNWCTSLAPHIQPTCPFTPPLLANHDEDYHKDYEYAWGDNDKEYEDHCVKTHGDEVGRQG